MSYATVDDLNERFGEAELLDVADDGTGALDASRVATALVDASELIDSYLRTRGMTVPVAPAPGVLVAACADIARFKLHDDEAPEEIRERYKATITWLKDIGAGRATLGAGDAQHAPTGRVVRREGASGFDWDRYVS